MNRKLLPLITALLILASGFYLDNFTDQKVLGVDDIRNLLTAPKEEAVVSPDQITVVRVVDGDTIIINNKGVQEKVRLIGIDTPESKDPRKKVECFANAATKKAEDLLLNKPITLEPDPTQQERDRYGRLLRYVFLPGNILVNELLIKEGFAYEYTYSTSYKYQERFIEAEQEAQRNKSGLWADSTCRGER